MARYSVHKFGGTSLETPERYLHAATLLEGADRPLAVVASAMAGVTDALLELCDLACGRDPSLEERFGAVLERHRAAIRELLDEERAKPLLEALEREGRDLHDLLRGAWLLKDVSEPTEEFLSGHGEVWSARLLAAVLERRGVRSLFVDAREILVVEPGRLGPQVVWGESQGRVARLLGGEDGGRVLVVTGFVCATPDGVPATLKRNGSDYSASIFANLLDAREITIWTDVDGVLTADPRKVPEAVVTPELSYAEAMELAYFGAKVLHPSTMEPAVDKRIPLRIKNSLKPESPGTRIGPNPGQPAAAVRAESAGVKGFATIDDIALLNVEGTGMIGVPGVAERVFGALKSADVNVVLIAQASSEHSICLAVRRDDGQRARAVLLETFEGEMRRGQLHQVDLDEDCAILAAVGEGMAETPGVAGKLMGALGRAGVNIRAVAQGSSERNISLVVENKDIARGLRAAHAGFYLSEQTVSVGLIGPGLIGAALLEQLRRQAAALQQQFHIDIRVRGVMSSKKMVLADPHLDLATWREAFAAGEPADIDAFTAHVQAPHLPHAVVIDCTAADFGDRYLEWLDAGIHVLTPNKKANSGPQVRYEKLRGNGRLRRAHYFYEATVGAGLPVIKTLRDLLQTGDRVLAIEGVLSGTLSYLFNTLTPEVPFSRLVREAKERGFTEPDPRDDLSGMDVARKVVILAREMGLTLELKDLPVTSLVPAALAEAPSAEAFLEGLAAFDGEMRARLEEAAAQGCVLRYVGVVEQGGGARVELRSYPKEHAFGRLQGSDNIIAFTTERYREEPLIVQGPGAGPEVTAAGVFADLLRLTAHLGAPS